MRDWLKNVETWRGFKIALPFVVLYAGVSLGLDAVYADKGGNCTFKLDPDKYQTAEFQRFMADYAINQRTVACYGQHDVIMKSGEAATLVELYFPMKRKKKTACGLVERDTSTLIWLNELLPNNRNDAFRAKIGKGEFLSFRINKGVYESAVHRFNQLSEKSQIKFAMCRPEIMQATHGRWFRKN